MATATDPAAALTDALLDNGWTHARDVRTDPQHRYQTHELASPDGRLHLDIARYPNGSMIALLSADATRGDPGQSPGWTAALHGLSLPAALAVIKAAAAPATPHDVASTLAAHGWTQREDVTEDDGRLLERAWDSPDRTRAASWFPADEHDLGGWTVTRPDPDHRTTEFQISQFTPTAVIAAFTFTD